MSATRSGCARRYCTRPSEVRRRRRVTTGASGVVAGYQGLVQGFPRVRSAAGSADWLHDRSTIPVRCGGRRARVGRRAGRSRPEAGEPRLCHGAVPGHCVHAQPRARRGGGRHRESLAALRSARAVGRQSDARAGGLGDHDAGDLDRRGATNWASARAGRAPTQRRPRSACPSAPSASGSPSSGPPSRQSASGSPAPDHGRGRRAADARGGRPAGRHRDVRPAADCRR